MKTSKRLLLAAILAILASLALAACGGGGESDEDKVTEVITEAATEETPENCTELLTLKFNEQTQKSSGKEAIDDCKEEAEEGNSPDFVKVTNVQVDGANAKADVAFTGGDFDGQTLTVALVEEDDQWKLDEVLGFAHFDRGKLLAAFSAGIEEEDASGAEAELYECVAEGLEGLQDRGLEELILSSSEKPIIELVEACE